MRIWAAIFFVFWSIARPQAQSETRSDALGARDAYATSQVAIEVKINPETRLSTRRGSRYPPVATCGEPVELPVRIVNHGFVTALLKAYLVEPAPQGVEVEFSPEPLTGRTEENRSLWVTLTGREPVDITIAFHIKGDHLNLRGADQVSLFVRCL